MPNFIISSKQQYSSLSSLLSKKAKSRKKVRKIDRVSFYLLIICLTMTAANGNQILEQTSSITIPQNAKNSEPELQQEFQSIKPAVISGKLKRQQADDSLEQIPRIGNNSTFVKNATVIFEEQGEPSRQIEDIPGVGLSIVFVFGGLLMGGLLKVFSRITHFPYNPLLILAGLSLGYYNEHLRFVGKAVILISQLNPNGIIAIFLPALIFESAFKTEWHMFKKQSGQTLILGIPCAILGAAFIMLAIKLILPFTSDTFSWTQAFLIGSILSCTDIFSFVQRLRNHGTPQKIITLIQGESLINYCTCVLVFQLINQIVVDYERSSFLFLIQLFIEQTLGGMLFGLLFGVFALLCLKRIIYDGVLVVTIMVIFCYSIYLIAEFSVLRVSGIVSIVVYALYMNVFGKTILTGQVSRYVDTFWSYIVFVAETSIFLIAGVNIGVNIFSFQDLISEEEMYIAFFIYIVCLASRFMSITCFIKWLSKQGYGMNMKEAFVIAYTGLKGAIGISLGMLVFENHDYSEKMRHFTLFLIAGNSILSLVINATSAGFIVKLLGLSTLTKVEHKFFKEFLFTFQNKVIEKKIELKDEKYLQMVNWEEIDMLIGMPNFKKMQQQTDKFISKAGHKNDVSKFQKRQMYKLEEVLKSYTKKSNNAMGSSSNLLQSQHALINTSNITEQEISSQNAKFELIVELRKRFIKASISKYWEYHDESYIAPGALLLLLQSAYFDLDTETEELESWSWIKSQISYNIKFLSELMKISILNQVAKSYLFQYISYCYDIVSSYIQACELVRREFRSFSLVAHQKDVLEIIMVESEENQKEAETFLRNYLQPSFPQIQRDVITRKATYHVISHFKKIANRFYETGQLEVNEFEILKNIIDKKSYELDLSNAKWEVTEFIDLLKEDSQVFGLLPEAVLQVLAKDLSEEQTFDVNQKIHEYGQISKFVYFVKKGGVQVQFINDNAIYKQSYLKGQLIGFQSLVSNIYRSTATANTMVTTIAIKKTSIQKIMDAFPVFEEAFWKTHIFELYKMFTNRQDLTFHLSHLKMDVIVELLNNFTLQVYEKGKYFISKDMIFLRGEIQLYSPQSNGQIKEEIDDQQESQVNFKKSRSSMTMFTVHPLMFISKSDSDKQLIEVLQKSTFLIGQVDYDLIDKENRFFSHGGLITSVSGGGPNRSVSGFPMFKKRQTLDVVERANPNSPTPLDKKYSIRSSSHNSSHKQRINIRERQDSMTPTLKSSKKIDTMKRSTQGV